MFKDFRNKILDEYIKKSIGPKINKMIKNLKKRQTNNDEHESIEISFAIKNGLIYHIDAKKRLCVPQTCEQKFFQLTHDQNNHVEHNQVYMKLIKTIYISKLSRKIKQYIKHCFVCELHQTKKHASYEKLISIEVEMISFKIITMNFIVALSKTNHDFLFIIICKTSKRVTLIFEMITRFAENGTNALFDRFMITNGNISENIISNKNFKFVFEFGTTIFKRLKTTLLISTTYHSQIDEQFERTNQTIEIALRYFIAENSKKNGIKILSLIQNQLNNSSNVNINFTSNQICYEFNIKNVITTLFRESFKKESKNVNELKLTLNKTRFRIRQKIVDVVIFVNVKTKIIYDKKHKFIMLKSENRIFLILNKNYKLSSKFNKKLFQQKNDLFLMKKRINRMIYELKLSSIGKIHFVINVTQFEFDNEKNLYEKKRSNHSKFVEIKKNILKQKSGKIEKVIKKRLKKYEKFITSQYLIKGKDYGSENDVGKKFSQFENCMKLMKNFEIKKQPKHEKFEHKSKKRIKKKKKSFGILFKTISKENILKESNMIKTSFTSGNKHNFELYIFDAKTGGIIHTLFTSRFYSQKNCGNETQFTSITSKDFSIYTFIF